MWKGAPVCGIKLNCPRQMCPELEGFKTMKNFIKSEPDPTPWGTIIAYLPGSPSVYEPLPSSLFIALFL